MTAKIPACSCAESECYRAPLEKCALMPCVYDGTPVMVCEKAPRAWSDFCGPCQAREALEKVERLPKEVR